jgi:hypothetical protein
LFDKVIGYSVAIVFPARVYPQSCRITFATGHDLLDADDYWEIWTSWYEKRLPGDTANQDMELVRVTIDDSIWEQEPRAVNAHIGELLEERGIFQHALADESENLPNADAIPRQTNAASRFALDLEARLDLLPDAPLPDDTQRKIYQDVRYKAVALSGLGHNHLLGCLSRLRGS